MIKIAVVGFGWWGRHIVARLKYNPYMCVVLVIEPLIELKEEIKALGLDVATEFETALRRDDIGAVVLTTPHMLHEEQVLACAKAKKHVFCEKPLAMNGSSARRVVSACSSANVVLGIGHERRFEPAMVKLKAMIDTGELGTVMHTEAAFSHNKLVGIPDGSWRTSKQDSPGAGMTGMGIHLTDLFIWMFGRINEIQAQTRDRFLGWSTGDMVVAQLGFEAGMTASLQAILATPHFMRFHVFGSKGWAEIRNDTHPDTPGGTTYFTLADKDGNQTTEQLDWSDAVVANLEAFASAITRESTYPWSNEELIHNIEVFQGIVESANTGETVRLSAT